MTYWDVILIGGTPAVGGAVVIIGNLRTGRRWAAEDEAQRSAQHQKAWRERYRKTLEADDA